MLNVPMGKIKGFHLCESNEKLEAAKSMFYQAVNLGR